MSSKNSKMDIQQVLIEQFNNFAVSKQDLTDPVLNKCVSLCTEYNLSGEEFVNQWIAFTLSNSVDVVPTVSTISHLERKGLAKKQKNLSTPARKTPNLKVYQTTPKAVFSEDVVMDYLPQNGTPKRSTPQIKRQFQPDDEDQSFKKIQILPSNNLSTKQSFTTCRYTQDPSLPSTKYHERVCSGKVVETFGDQADKIIWRGKNQDLNITKNVCSNSYLHGEDMLSARLSAEKAYINMLIKAIIHKNTLKGHVIAHKAIEFKGCLYLGRVVNLNEKWSNKLITLENLTPAFPYGEKVILNAQRHNNYCLYEGQIVVVLGTNPLGKGIFPKRIYFDGHAPCSNLPFKGSTPIQLAIASGPFTLNDNLAFDPLTDFISYVKSHKPDVAILIGPFLNEKHEQIADGMLAERFEDYFERLIHGIMEPLSECNTQVMIVSSYRDAACDKIYPTPPYSIRKSYRNLHLCLDPSVININGVVIGVTSVDVITQIGLTWKSKPQDFDNQETRIISHMLEQRSMFPGTPNTDEIPVDGTFWSKHCILKESPHVLIIPSEKRHFIQDVKGCVAVNPQMLANGQEGGTFARMEITPGEKPGSLSKNIICQIIKI